MKLGAHVMPPEVISTAYVMNLLISSSYNTAASQIIEVIALILPEFYVHRAI
jgi:hypothetical protein